MPDLPSLDVENPPRETILARDWMRHTGGSVRALQRLTGLPWDELDALVRGLAVPSTFLRRFGRKIFESHGRQQDLPGWVDGVFGYVFDISGRFLYFDRPTMGLFLRTERRNDAEGETARMLNRRIWEWNPRRRRVEEYLAWFRNLDPIGQDDVALIQEISEVRTPGPDGQVRTVWNAMHHSRRHGTWGHFAQLPDAQEFAERTEEPVFLWRPIFRGAAMDDYRSRYQVIGIPARGWSAEMKAETKNACRDWMRTNGFEVRC